MNTPKNNCLHITMSPILALFLAMFCVLVISACSGEDGSSAGLPGVNLQSKFVNVFVEPIKENVLANADVIGVNAAALSTQNQGLQTLGLEIEDLQGDKEAFYRLVDLKRTGKLDSNCTFVKQNYNLYNFSNSSAFSLSFAIPAFISAEYNYFDTYRHYCEAIQQGLFKGGDAINDFPKGEQVLLDDSSDVFKYTYDTFTSSEKVKYGRFRFYMMEKKRPLASGEGSTGLFNTRGSQTAALDIGGEQENKKARLSILHNVVLYPAGEQALQTGYVESHNVDDTATTKMFQKLSVVGMNIDGSFTFTGSRARFYDRGPVYDFGDYSSDTTYSKQKTCKVAKPLEKYRVQAALGYNLAFRYTDASGDDGATSGTPYFDTYCNDRESQGDTTANRKWLGKAADGFMPYENYFIAIENGTQSLVMKVNCMADATENAKVANQPPCVVSDTSDPSADTDFSADTPKYHVGGQFMLTLHQGGKEVAQCHYGNNKDNKPAHTCSGEGEQYFNQGANSTINTLVQKILGTYNQMYVFELVVDPAEIKSVMNTDLNKDFDPQFYGTLIGDIAPDSGSSGDGSCNLVDKVSDIVEIDSASELQKLSTDATNGTSCKNYVLVDTIDLSGSAFTPIGTKEKPFQGSLNGNDYTIDNLTVDSGDSYIGLFGYIDNPKSVIKNLHIRNANVTGNAIVGAVVGHLAAGEVHSITLSNSRITSTGQAEDTSIDYDKHASLGSSGSYLGGIAGVVNSDNANIYAVNITDDVTINAGGSGTSSYVGGIVGAAVGTSIAGIFEGSVDTSDTSGTSISSEYIGGIAGLAVNAKIQGVHTGTVLASLTEENYDFLNDASNANDIADSQYIGGLVGGAFDSKVIGITKHGAKVGNLGNSFHVAGLVGRSDGSFIYGVNEGVVYGGYGTSGLTNALSASNIQGYNVGDIFIAESKVDANTSIDNKRDAWAWASAYGLANITGTASRINGYSAGRIFNYPVTKPYDIRCASFLPQGTIQKNQVYCLAPTKYKDAENTPYAYFVHSKSNPTLKYPGQQGATTTATDIFAYFNNAPNSVDGFIDKTDATATVSLSALSRVDENSVEEFDFSSLSDTFPGGFVENIDPKTKQVTNYFPRLFFSPSYPFHGQLPTYHLATQAGDRGVYPLSFDDPPTGFVLPSALSSDSNP